MRRQPHKPTVVKQNRMGFDVDRRINGKLS
jgi:hypothetical protein